MSNPADSTHAASPSPATDTPGAERARPLAAEAPAPVTAAPLTAKEPAPDAAPAHHRGIRSYVLRRSHFSNAQRDAFERLMPVFGLRYQDSPLDYTAAFGRAAPVVLEIGFGMGDTTAEIAANAPDINFIAIDVHTPGVGALLKLVEQKGLQNLRVMEHDATEVMANMIAPDSLDGIHVFFPDPWPKARHHKRRLIQPPFVAQLISRLKPGGYLHLATDWQDYADQMAEVLAGFESLSDSAPGPMLSASLPCPRPSTRFERRGERLGHGITDLIRYRVA
ncbi:MAG: tRNA (guanosine(46)-N7)-methyltransferase TrmB [Lautropia sp.]|nr:tRNA (guanosine(46)-N7)-methyltransferase TrmB [Lautropia sp.]